MFLFAPVHADETATAGGGPNAATLQWSAPGDDGPTAGTATGYDIRFSRDPITPANFAQATHLNSLLLPGPSGSKQTFSITGLTPGVTYHFAVKSVDEKGNWSSISNVATIVAGATSTSDPVISEPHFSNPWPNPAKLGTRFTVSLPKAQSLRIDAYDVSGRLVKTLTTGEHSAGTFDLGWDLRDHNGQMLRAGVYMIRGQIGERVFIRRLTMVH
jgi:hypothetical protein